MWFTEYSNNQQWVQGFQYSEILHEETSTFQNIKVLQSPMLGRVLLLDDKTMVSHLDEFIYHEIMAHIPLMVHPQAKRVMIIGGGDAGIVTQLVKHPQIEEIHLVEIDERVVKVSQEFFPDISKGLNDPRVKLFAEDGLEFIKNIKKPYDIILVDSTDPVDFAAGLFTESFYQMIFDALTEDGIMMNQTENPFLTEFNVKDIYQRLQKIFPISMPLVAPMLIYPGVFWSFGFNSKKWKGDYLQSHHLNFMKDLQQSLKWYNLEWHQKAFVLDNFSKKQFGILS